MSLAIFLWRTIIKDLPGLTLGPIFLSLCFRNWLIVVFHWISTKFGPQNVTLQLDGLHLKGTEKCQLQFKNLNFQIYLTAYSWWETLSPLVGMLSVVLRKKVESVLLNERKFAARSSSPWSLRGLPSLSVSCCAAFPWARARVGDNWNGRRKRPRLMAVVFITSSTWASVKVIIYTCRCPAGPMGPVDRVLAVISGQTAVLCWHLGLLRVRKAFFWLGRAKPKFQHPVWTWELDVLSVRDDQLLWIWWSY